MISSSVKYFKLNQQNFTQKLIIFRNKTLEIIGQICPPINLEIGKQAIDLGYNILEDLENVALGCESFNAWFDYLADDMSCDMMFQKLFTNDGLCITFNALDGNNLFREEV